MAAGRGEQRRHLITGAYGAIGVWTMRSLLDDGHEVVAFDLGDAAHRLPLALSPEQIEGLVRVRGDITDPDALARVLDEHAITDVIHLAALQVPFVRADPALGARVNVVGTVNVFEAVRARADRMGPIVYASSIAVFGTGGTLDGDDPPGTLYGAYKRTNEHTAVRYAEDYGVSSIGLRPHTVYGPGRDQGVTSAPTTAMVAALAGVPFEIPYGGSAQLQYTPDVGRAFARAGQTGREGASVHNLDGPVVSMQEVVGLIEAAVPAAAGTITAGSTPLPFPSGVDGTSFVELLGGSVMRPIDAGVGDAVREFERLLDAGLVAPPTA
jgi:UDP-glucuronate 4-epimerase